MRYENIRKLLKEKGLRQTDLAALLGRDKSVITHLMQGKRKLSAEEAVKLAHFFDVEVNVILDDPQAAALLGDTKKRASLAESHRIPFQSAPSFNQKNSLIQKEGGSSYLSVEKAEAGDAALEVPDNSMNLAGLIRGDIVVFSETLEAKAGDIVVVQCYAQGGAESLLRRYQPPILKAESSDSDASDFKVDSDNIRVIAPIKRLLRSY